MAKTATAVEGAATSKVANLTFSTEEELGVYEAYAAAAKADDRSVPAFLVRVLCGKEDAIQLP
jgi:hypothetical protein